MKSLLTIFIFSVAVCQVFDIYATAEKVKAMYRPTTITVFFETLNTSYLNFYEDMAEIVTDPVFGYSVYFDLVPFGLGSIDNYDINWVTCEHGPYECYGNSMLGCFFDMNPHQIKQVLFLNCVMHHVFPPHAGEQCAQYLGFSFDGVHDCIYSRRGRELLYRNAQRAIDFRPRITRVPAVFINNVYNERSLTDLKGVIGQMFSMLGNIQE